jgi:hypothetical protein
LTEVGFDRKAAFSVAEQTLLEPQPASALAAFPEGEPTAEQMIRTGEAAEIIGCSARTVERWADDGWIKHGRPVHPITGRRGWRWVDARHAVQIAVALGRGHLVPAKWQHLVPQVPAPRTPTSEANLTAR